MFVAILCCLIVGYGFGCFSTGHIVGKFHHIDITEYGSGNNGATNTLRTLGKKAGIVTLLGDIFKGIIAILIMRAIFKEDLSRNLITLYTGLGAILGHDFPCWMKFKGGKGIATMGGVVIMFNIWYAVVILSIFILIVAISKYVSLGSILGSMCIPASVAIFCTKDPDYIHMVILCLIYAALAIYKHKANIKRLLSGTENKIGQKVKVQ